MSKSGIKIHAMHFRDATTTKVVGIPTFGGIVI